MKEEAKFAEIREMDSFKSENCLVNHLHHTCSRHNIRHTMSAEIDADADELSTRQCTVTNVLNLLLLNVLNDFNYGAGGRIRKRIHAL